MDLKTFLENFDAIAEAPGGISKLRLLILELAVRAKLVPQNLEDELPSFALNIDTKVEEVAYCIPPNWTWVQLGQVINFVNGFAFKSSEFVDCEIGVVRIGDIVDGQVDDSSMKRVNPNYLKNLDHKFRVCPGDMLIAMSGATTGKLGFNKNQEIFLLNQRVGKIIPTNIYGHYLYYFLNTQIKKNLEASFGSAIPNLSTQYINSIPTPLPPLAEQKRIVAKVDELMGLCDRYEAAKQTRDKVRQKLRESAIASLMNAETDEDLDAAWAIVRDNWHNLSQYPQDVSDLRQAVLQLAVRGKLVPQNFEDEPASVLLEKVEAQKRDLIKEKKLKERWNPVPVSPNAIPYKIPMNWKWIRILDGVERVTVGHVGSMQNEYLPEGLPFLRSQNVRENRFDPLGLKFISQEFHDKLAKSKLSPRDVVVVRSGNVGTTCVIPEELEDANCSDLVIVKRPMAIDSGFLSYYMNSAAKSHVKEGTVGIALTHFNTESVASLPIPLPPLAEQKRIVAKVDELMKLCDQLEASLRQSQQRAESLAASAISHLTI
jgi:type I restriction enzyme S subunit